MDYIGLQHGERLGAEGTVGNTALNEFQRLIAGLHAWGDIEHNGDGTHADITAASVDTTGDVNVGGDFSVDGLVGPLDFGGDDAPIVLDGATIGPETWFDSSGFPSAGFTADITTPVLRATRSIVPADTSHDLGYYGATDRRWRNGLFSHLVESPYVHASTGLYERFRDTAVGIYTPVSFSAGNFTTDSGTAWALTSGDQLTFAYTLVGKMMTIAFEFATTSVAAATAIELRFAIPASQVAARRMSNAIVVNDNGTIRAGQALVTAGDTIVRLYAFPLSTTKWSAAANTTGAHGQITFEVQ